METALQKPTKKDRDIAKAYAKEFEKVLDSEPANNAVEIKFKRSSITVKVPKKAMEVFSAVLQQMAEGNSVTLVSGEDHLSTQEAADLLHVSRPHLIKLLEKGEMPYTLVGTHRRVHAKDIQLYKQKLEKIQQRQLAFLAKQAQELNLGYQ
jgi:excisionase family DNA binding protein